MPLDPKLCPMLSAGRQGGIHSFNFWKSALTMACVGTHVAVDAARLRLPHVHCDERYAASVTCAGRQFFFTRREVGNDLWETLARIGTPGAITAVRSPDFSPPLVTLPHTAKVSHNAAFLCIANRTLVAYGGQAFRNSSHERGVMRLAAKATQWPLSWGRPRLVLSGEPEHSSCVEERPIEPWLPWSARPAAGFTCEFDGKLGAVQHGGKVFVFSCQPIPRPWRPACAGGHQQRRPQGRLLRQILAGKAARVPAHRRQVACGAVRASWSDPVVSVRVSLSAPTAPIALRSSHFGTTP